MSGSLLRRRRKARSDERGAVSIEAALIFPVVMLLGVGIIEWSLVLRDQIALTSLARAGARSASSLAPDPTIPYPLATFSDQVVGSMNQATSALPSGSVQYALVYLPGSPGMEGDPADPGFDCGYSAQCARYSWDAEEGAFIASTGTWDGWGINACLGDPNMTDVGVYVQSRHDMLTGVFGSSATLSAFTVMRMDPQRPGRCSS